MESYTFKSIIKTSLKETSEAIRMDKPVRWFVALGTILGGGGISWFITKQYSLTAIVGFGALLLVGFVIFVCKLVTVPLAVAAQTDRTRRDAEASLGARIDALEKERANQRDPDTIYQLGSKVGSVVHATEVKQHGIIHFAQIQDAADLNSAAEFEYRNYILRLTRSDGRSEAFMGSFRNVTILNATCQVLRLRS